MQSTSHRSRLCSLLGLIVVTAVAVPTLVAAYRHARDVVGSVGDPVMAPWLPASIVGLLLAALGVIWVRRRAVQPAGLGAWAAAGFAMLVLVGANLAVIDRGSMLAYAVAVFPPIALAVTLALVATFTLGAGYRAGQPDASRTDAAEPWHAGDSGEDSAAARSAADEQATPKQPGTGAPSSAEAGQRPPPGSPERRAEQPASSESKDLVESAMADRETDTPGATAEPARQARKRPSPGPTTRARGAKPPRQAPPAEHGQASVVPDAGPEQPPRATSPRARAKQATVPAVAGPERQRPSDLLSLPAHPDGIPRGRPPAAE